MTTCSTSISTPDIIQDESHFDPMQLVQQLLKGFCDPLNDNGALREASSCQSLYGNHNSDDIPRCIQLVASSELSRSSNCFVKSDSSGCVDSENDTIVIETMPGTSRALRAIRGFETLVCTAVIFLVTVYSLKKYVGVDFGFQIQPKIMETGDSDIFCAGDSLEGYSHIRAF
jgi:hypothetical protein